MLVAALKPGHDGALAVVEDRRLIMSLESEKSSFPRHSSLTPTTLVDIAEHVDRPPDVVAVGGWQAGRRSIAAGYSGISEPSQREGTWFGKKTKLVTSSHVRSHIMMAMGMAPRPAAPGPQAVLVWEGIDGSFYLVDEHYRVQREIPVMSAPGARYAFLYALADPTFPDHGAIPALSDSGKLMALAAYGDASQAGASVGRTIDHMLSLDDMYPAPKHAFLDSPVHNAGVESQITKDAAALLTERIYATFRRAAESHIPEGLPLRVSGGCGLNCEWNRWWRSEGFFSSVFVPPCTNDSGSAIGTAADALYQQEGDPHIEWSVYSGLEFDDDHSLDPDRWSASILDWNGLVRALDEGRVIAWVQGRWEIGPRALGNRSLLAEPFHSRTTDRLNFIKQRESYRPIAPCCRVEDLRRAYEDPFVDPYMLYFQRVVVEELRAVTHVDGTARVQAVDRESNEPLHKLLSAYAERHGIGVLCNTSLNFKGCGFINRMSDLVAFCEAHGVTDMVVGNTWYRERVPRV